MDERTIIIQLEETLKIIEDTATEFSEDEGYDESYYREALRLLARHAKGVREIVQDCHPGGGSEGYGGERE